MDNNLEEYCVLKFYKNNADAFSQNRNTPWMPVRSFLSQYWKLGMITLDYGCGNGRNIPREGVGIDITKELLYNYALKQSLVHCDGISLPFKNESFDLILNVAVIQHFYHQEKREKALKECYKVLKKKGKSFITATSFEYQKKVRHKKISENDILVYSKRINEYLIYHHLFSEKELVCLVESVGFVVLEMGALDNNVYVIVEK